VQLAPRFPITTTYSEAPGDFDRSTLLGTIAFGEAEASGSIELLATVPLRQLGPTLFEVWTSATPVERGESGTIRFARNDDVLLGAISSDAMHVEASARDLYVRIVSFARQQGFPYLLRFWNHVPEINSSASGLEEYRCFSRGRYEAFKALGYAVSEDLPAASAVGSHGGNLAVYFLASTAPGIQIENPRQISAYRYPVEYGPKSPSFSRATMKEWENGFQVYVSGTASIVGHESLHHGDLAAQLDETVTNLDVLLRAAGKRQGLDGGIERLSSAKVFVRHPRDFEEVQERFARMVPDAAAMYVEADICRSELLLEIEGIAEFF
jgi:chorismate lyase/3-hydroxybenzoate synthase